MRFELHRTRVLEALARELESTPLLLLTAPRGGGKTHVLERLFARARARGKPSALAQLEPISGSPEILDSELARLAGGILGRVAASGTPAFDSILRRLGQRRTGSILFLDDVTEIRTLSYYPGVDDPLGRFLAAIENGGRAVLTSRFSYWMRHRYPELPARMIPKVSTAELEEAGAREPEAVASTSAGIAVHALSLAESLERGSSSIESALFEELSPGGRIEAECRATLSELLHRARGYGACKTVLHVLSDEQGLKLSEVARRVDRTPGSTRDYLRWLEEVDLVEARDKRYYFVDPVLRVWTRIYGRGVPPGEEDLRRETEAYLEGLAPEPTPSAPSAEQAVFTLPRQGREEFID
jgi:hypothetical protein